MDVKSFIFLNIFCLFVLYFNPCVEGDALYGLCANLECSTPISRGITILRYSSPDDSRVSVEPNEEVQIYVKEYGPKKDLWGVVVRGNKGYISKQFIRETNLFVKELVPAPYEFKTPVLVTDSYTVGSHISSLPSHQPMHSSDYHLRSSIPNNIQQQDFTSSVSNNLQQQQGFVNSVPNSNQQPPDFVNPSQNSFQQQQNIFNSAPSNSHEKWNSLGENQLYSSSSSVNPSPNLGLQPELHQSNQFSNSPEQSSQFHMHSENILNLHKTTGMQSQEILPSAFPSNVHSPSDQHFSGDPSMNSFSSVPNSFHSDNFNPSVAPSQGFQSPHQFSSNEQFQNIHSPHAQGIHPSLLSDDYLDDDYSRTLAMLSSLGFESSDMYTGQEAIVQPSSQNIERNLDFSAKEFNSMSSQLEHSSVETSDAAVHSTIDPTLPINANNLINSGNSKQFRDSSIPPENFNNIPDDKFNSVPPSKVMGSSTDMVNEDNSNEEIEDSELLSEENADDFDDGTDEENDEDEEEEEESDASTIKLTSSVNSIDNVGSSLGMQSLDSSQINLQTSEKIPDLQSSRKDSMHDSNTIDSFSRDHSTFTQGEQLEISLSNTPSGINIVPQENKFSVDTHSVLKSSMTENVKKTESVNNFVQSSSSENIDINLNTIDPIVSNTEKVQEKKVNLLNTFPEDLSGNLDRNNNDPLTSESGIYKKDTTPKVSDFLMENEKRAEVEQILSPLDIDGLDEDLTTYQGRNLKGEYGTTDDPLSDTESNNDENNTQTDSDSYSSYGNWFDALKSVIDAIVSWIPEPLYSSLMDLQKKGISPRVPVFTVLCGFTCIFLIVPLFYLKDRSKENKLSVLLAEAEKKVYECSATNAVLEEKLESLQAEIAGLQSSLAEEKSLSENLNIDLENQAEELENAKAELDSCLEIIDTLKEKENEYLTLMGDYEKEKECYTEHKESLDKIMKEQESTIESLTSQLQESENKVQELEKEKEQFLLMKTDYEDKLAQFDQNCNQLLQEAEVWNMRVKELTETVNAEMAIKEELMSSLKAKDEEIESLKELVETFKVLDEIEDPEEQAKTKEEKLQLLLNSVMITNQLKKEEEKSKLLDEQLQQEKSKILDMEVELLEAKSEIDKLKLNYNQALQDKAEAQTKLEVLTNYFKDKEIQLQRQLGAQEADRQKKEEDVNSAERRIMLIEQENASYKSQVASMKQEMEETERTLRSQIATQEKKAHENWIAARAAERNLENMKQEVTQLRQRLTLLEREQENWANASRDEIIRPVPKRIPGVNEESGNQETSERGMFPPPPYPPMMLPPDRPLPPLPPPPMPPMFLPPPPPMDRHFRPQPWHMPPEHSSDYRTTPPEFMAGRESTPPRGRPPIVDGDVAPNTSSPMTTDTRDSRNSTPPHLLPDFHDIPPQPGRPYFPPHVGRPRYPMHPPYRRDAGPEPKRLDNQNESNSRGPPQPPPSEHWQHSRV